EHLGGSLQAAEVPARLAAIAAGLARLAVHRSWVPVAPIVLVAVVLVLRGAQPGLRLPLLVLGLYVLMLIGVYLVAPLDTAFLLETSAERVFGAVVPAVALLGLAGARAAAGD